MATSYDYPLRDPAKLSDTEVLAEAHELVEAFLELLRGERIGHDILDAADLPASKASLEASLRLVIATEPRKHVRDRLSSAGMALAQFQPGIGQRMSIAPASKFCAAGRTRDASEKDGRQFDLAFAQMALDTDRLRQVFASAEAMAERRFEQVYIRPPFREDGTYNWYGHH